MPQEQIKRRVLSIQSHVVHGYVGNKSASFPLQVLGFEIDAINSVQFSNHTGYEVVKGQVLQQNDLNDIFEGLAANNLLSSYSHLLTGYIGAASFLKLIVKIVKKLREQNPNIIYVCDTVLGDDGHMYVPEDLLPIFRDEIVPIADIVTPNQYEVSWLTGMTIKTEDDVWRAVEWFHNQGVSIVAISSTDFCGKNELKAFLSKKGGERYSITIPKQAQGIPFTGAGDLFSSLFLAHSYRCEDLGKAFEKTVATLQAVIKRTCDHLPAGVLEGTRKVTAEERELKLIQSKKDIEDPQIILRATKH